MTNQIEAVSLDMLVSSEHVYRKISELVDFKLVLKPLNGLKKKLGSDGYGVETLFKCLLLQYMEDLSDREVERYLEENNSAKWFCGFLLTDKTPSYSLFSKARDRIGSSRLSKCFHVFKSQLKSKGYMNEIFNFVDASDLVSKANLWKERDKAIAKKYEKLNNETLPKVAIDKDAKIGCKGKDKFWYGYKKHISVDMQSGMINKVAITPANVTDAKGLQFVCPSSGAVYMDKGYCTSDAAEILKFNGCHNASIKKNNMKGKNKDLDRWYSHIRAPYERVFSKTRKRVRYRGLKKNQFTALMEALVHNFKRLIVLEMG